MHKEASILVFAASLLLGISECPDSGEPTPEPWSVPGEDFSMTGDSAVAISIGILAAPSGCDLPFTRYMPEGRLAGPLIVLSHGFQRNQTHMADLAEHFASWGFEVVTPSLCHSVPADNDTIGDAEDMNALADQLGADSVIYVGHSAGGLRSTLAGVGDDKTLTVLGLDLVDAADEALEAAPQATFPLYGIIGEPSACNAAGNGSPIYENARDGRALKTLEADHCDFESPTDALCTSFCQGSNDDFTDGEIHRTLWGLSTAYLMWRGQVDASGETWWQGGGAAFEYLTDLGMIEVAIP